MGLEYIAQQRYSNVQKSVPVKLARLLPYITIGLCFDSHPRINSALQKSEVSPGTCGGRYRVLVLGVQSEITQEALSDLPLDRYSFKAVKQ